MQQLWHDYERHLGGPGKLRDAVNWGLDTGRLQLPRIDPKKKLLRDMKEAIRGEEATDERGIKYHVNASVTFVGQGGIQESFWGNIDSPLTPHEFVVEHFAQCRKGIVDNCYQLKRKVDHYTAAHPDRPAYQLVLTFDDDVEERKAMEAGFVVEDFANAAEEED
jgi:hypothetical protein